MKQVHPETGISNEGGSVSWVMLYLYLFKISTAKLVAGPAFGSVLRADVSFGGDREIFEDAKFEFKLGPTIE